LTVETAEPVDQARFSDAGRSDQCDSAPTPKMFFKPIEAPAVPDADRVDGNGWSDGFRFNLKARHIIAEISLIQNDHRLRSALPHHRQITLQTSWTEIPVQRADDKHRVDICSDDLLDRPSARCLPRELALPGKHVQNQTAAAFHPISNCRPFLWFQDPMPEASG